MEQALGIPQLRSEVGLHPRIAIMFNIVIQLLQLQNLNCYFNNHHFLPFWYSLNLLQVVGVEPCCAVTGDGLHAGVEHLHQVPLSIYTIVDHPHVFHQIKVMQAQN